MQPPRKARRPSWLPRLALLIALALGAGCGWRAATQRLSTTVQHFAAILLEDALLDLFDATTALLCLAGTERPGEADLHLAALERSLRRAEVLLPLLPAVSEPSADDLLTLNLARRLLAQQVLLPEPLHERLLRLENRLRQRLAAPAASAPAVTSEISR